MFGTRRGLAQFDTKTLLGSVFLGVGIAPRWLAEDNSSARIASQLLHVSFQEALSALADSKATLAYTEECQEALENSVKVFAVPTILATSIAEAAFWPRLGFTMVQSGLERPQRRTGVAQEASWLPKCTNGLLWRPISRPACFGVVPEGPWLPICTSALLRGFFSRPTMVQQ